MTDESSNSEKPVTERAEVMDGETVSDPLPTSEAQPPTTPLEPSPLPSRRAVIADVALVLAVYFLPLTGMAIQNYFNPLTPIPLAWSESALALQATGNTALGLYLIFRSGLPPAVFGLTRPRFTDLLFGGVLWVVMLFTLWLHATYGPTVPLWGVDRLPDQIWLPPQTGIDYTLVVIAACLNGLGEEVMVRGFFQTRLEQLTRSPVWSILISTSLFTAYHSYYGLNGMVSVFLIGLLFGVCFRVTKRLWIVAVSHALHNVVSMAQLGT